MMRVQIAPAGPLFSRIVAGMMYLARWQLTPAQRVGWIEAALDLGVTTFDHADIYGSYTCEALFGEALALKPSLRQRIELVTKCGINLLSPNRPQITVHGYNTTTEHIIRSAETSLRNLQTDYLDLLLIHRPDPLMDADAVATALTQLVASGKVRHVGVSNFLPWHFDLLQSRLDIPLVTNQVECSVLAFDVMHDGSLDQCQRLRIRPMAWSPVSGGRLFSGSDEQARRVRAVLARLGAAHSAGLDQMALAWIMQHPSGILPVLGTGKIDRVAAAVAALEIAWTRDDWFAVWEASKGHEVP